MNADQFYDALIRPHESQMIRSAWRVAQNAEDAEEAIQEAVAKLLANPDRLRSHANPKALILRVCIDAACDVRRKRLSHSRANQPLEDYPNEGAVDSQALAAERREWIARALLELPRQQAVAVSMRYLLERDYADVAAALDCSESTARVHVGRAIEKLRQKLIPLSETIGVDHDRKQHGSIVEND